MPEREWALQIDDPEMIGQLRLALNAFDRQGRSVTPKLTNAAPYLVDRFRSLRVEVFSNEHPPPHFRVKCGSETANYQISDCAQLNGGLGKYHGVIKNWHAENKQRLIEAWDSRRPTDCPVGAYREG
jgi:hypothetical protein